MYIGANDYSQYNPAWCDGHYCCRDCDECPIAEQMMEEEAQEECVLECPIINAL